MVIILMGEQDMRGVGGGGVLPYLDVVLVDQEGAPDEVHHEAQSHPEPKVGEGRLCMWVSAVAPSAVTRHEVGMCVPVLSVKKLDIMTDTKVFQQASPRPRMPAWHSSPASSSSSSQKGKDREQGV